MRTAPPPVAVEIGRALSAERVRVLTDGAMRSRQAAVLAEHEAGRLEAEAHRLQQTARRLRRVACEHRVRAQRIDTAIGTLKGRT